MRISTALAAVISLFAFGGCDDRTARLWLPTAPSAPAAPTSPAPPPTAAPGFGTIRTSVAITALIPASGATVSVRDCPPGPGGTQTILCTDHITTTFSVLNDGQERNARLRIVFADSTRECAWAWLPQASLASGTSMTFSASTVFLSLEASEGVGSPVSLLQPCSLPVTTSHIVLQMWDEGNSRAPVAVQEFDGSYTFVR
jgi:hypothetical protein